MTISLAWLKRNADSVELVFASDSRLRSRGPLDQAQKLFQLERGDCCLGFCGDAQVAYPVFVQVATTLNNHITTRTRAMDVTRLTSLVGDLLDNFVKSWDLPANEKAEELQSTRIMFGGWSWQHRRFDVGFFRFEAGRFRFHHQKTPLPHPWRETSQTLIFIGDYKTQYMEELKRVLNRRYPTHGDPHQRIPVQLRFEPLEALHNLLRLRDKSGWRIAVGGAPQVVKVYQFGNSLPFVVRTKRDSHFLLGRRLFEWEKTEHPIIDLSRPETVIVYPLKSIPMPRSIRQSGGSEEEILPVSPPLP